MASERTDELYKVLLDRGYPKEFCAEIAFNISEEVPHLKRAER